MPRGRPESQLSALTAIALVGQVGLIMAAAIGGGFLTGLYIDRWLGAGGLVLTIMILVGVAAGGYTVYRLIQKGFSP